MQKSRYHGLRSFVDGCFGLNADVTLFLMVVSKSILGRVREHMLVKKSLKPEARLLDVDVFVESSTPDLLVFRIHR